MDFQSLASLYRTKTDDELLNLAEQRTTLTSEAWVALSAELAIRRIDFHSIAGMDARDSPPDTNSGSRTEKPSIRLKTGEFIEEVLRFYHQNRWTFMKLIFPAVVVGTAAVIGGRYESHEISQHLYRENGIVRLQPRYYLNQSPVVMLLACFRSGWPDGFRRALPCRHGSHGF